MSAETFDHMTTLCLMPTAYVTSTDKHRNTTAAPSKIFKYQISYRMYTFN